MTNSYTPVKSLPCISLSNDFGITPFIDLLE